MYDFIAFPSWFYLCLAVLGNQQYYNGGFSVCDEEKTIISHAGSKKPDREMIIVSF